MDHDLVTIKDYGRAEYLDGAMMQYCVVIGEYPHGETVAYCDTIEVARLLANALTMSGMGQVIIQN